MELSQLIYATELAKYKNFSKTAETLYISQSALSQQIRKLEDELGFQVFKRSSKQVSLTFSGRRFLAQAGVVVDEMGRLRALAGELSGLQEGQLSLGVGVGGLQPVAVRLDSFLEEFKGAVLTRVEVSDADAIRMVREGALDLALVSLPPDDICPADLCAVEVWRGHMGAALGRAHRLAGRRLLTLRELAEERLVLSSPLPEQLLMRAFAREGLHPKPPRYADGPATAAKLILDGAIALATPPPDWGAYGFLTLPVEPALSLSLISPRGGEPSPLAEALRETLCSYINE